MKRGRYLLKNPKTGLDYVLTVYEFSAYISPNDGRVPSGQPISLCTAQELLGSFDIMEKPCNRVEESVGKA